MEELVREAASLLANAFIVLCAPLRHKEWLFDMEDYGIRVTVEMTEPRYRVVEYATGEAELA